MVVDTQMKKGVLDLCILHLVSTHDTVYGYDLMREVADFFPEVGESTVYAILRRLHKGAYLSVSIKESQEGPKRKYYAVTPKGMVFLQEQKTEWNRLVGITKALGMIS